MRKISILVVLFLMLLSGCKEQSQKGENAVDGGKQTFINQKYGYSLEMPVTWGTIQNWGGKFTSDLNEDLQEIGPEIGISDENDIYKYYINIEVFGPDVSREPGETWIDFYKRFRLANVNYHKQKLLNGITDFTVFGKPASICYLIKTDTSDSVTESENTDVSFESKCLDNNLEGEFYKQTCRLIEYSDKLYSFCFNRENNIHTDIVDSIKFE